MSDDLDEPDFLSLRCPHCQAGLRIRARLAGQTGTCPSCSIPFPIPHRPEVDFELPHPDEAVAVLDEAGGYRLATPLEHEADDQPAPLPKELLAAAPAAGYLDAFAQVRQQDAPVRPRFLFFSGIFDFPWYPEVWLRWTYLVIGGTAAALIPVVAISFLESSSGYVGVGVAFFALPQIWITIWTGSFAAACGMQVFEDTAAGCDRINAWPEPNWREWMLALMHLVYVGLMVLALGYGIGLLIGGPTQTMLLTLAIAEFVLFPICLLSVLEANNIAVLLSSRILWTLIQRPVGWLLFYLLTGGIFAAWYGIALYVGRYSLPLVIVVHGLMYASVSLIWFRLLGRLGWLISHRTGKKRRGSSRVAGANLPP